ncbi:MAG: 23S rRNA (uracil(1939)-C(5))-methyltransferase RlmD [Prevotellaceae bacterium]|nr:23S rRNA (uracil(1939)-C(5))-methyltransferase RlmD [Prevotellaceae bacterium]
MPQLFFPPHTGGKVRDLSQEGNGIVALNSPDPAWQGRVLSLPDTVPGDEIEVLAYQSSGKRLAVTDYKLVQPSPDRQDAFCPHFASCGGCQLQDLTYQATLAWKRKHVADLLQRMAKLPISVDAVKPCLSLTQPLAFRSIVRLHVNPLGQLCFYGRKPQELIPINTCPIQSDQVNGLRQLVQALLTDQPSSEVAKLSSLEIRQNAENDAFMLTFNFHAQPLAPDWQDFFTQVRDQAGEALGRGEASACASLSLWLAVGEDYVHIAGPEQLRMTENGLDFDFSPRAFQQTNLQLNQILYQEVVKAAQMVADSKAGDASAIISAARLQQYPFKILELYCGSGTISLHLAQAFPEAQITGVEIVPEAIADAKHNAELNGFASDRLRFEVGDAGQALRQPQQPVSAQLSGESQETGPASVQPPYDLLVVDPPRQGLDPQLCQDILASNIPHIIYVSCDPATLARDLKTLKHAYSLQNIQPLDMFPWTTHVECAVLMSRVDK